MYTVTYHPGLPHLSTLCTFFCEFVFAGGRAICEPSVDIAVLLPVHFFVVLGDFFQSFLGLKVWWGGKERGEEGEEKEGVRVRGGGRWSRREKTGSKRSKRGGERWG